MKRTYPTIRTVTCKCDVCLNETDFSENTHSYDSESGYVVCSDCLSDHMELAKVWETPVIWESVPEVRVNYNEEEYEPDYDND